MFSQKVSDVGIRTLESTPALALQAGGRRFDPVTAHSQQLVVAYVVLNLTLLLLVSCQ